MFKITLFKKIATPNGITTPNSEYFVEKYKLNIKLNDIVDKVKMDLNFVFFIASNKILPNA
jgi:hypothetical protein